MATTKPEGIAFIQQSVLQEKLSTTIAAQAGIINSPLLFNRLPSSTFINKDTTSIEATTMILASNEELIASALYKGSLTNIIEGINKFNKDELSIQTVNVYLNRDLFQSSFPVPYQSLPLANHPLNSSFITM